MEWGKFRATIGVWAYIPFVTHIFVIALTPSAGHAHGLVLPLHADAPILAVADANEFTAQKSEAAPSTWDWRLTGTILTPNLRMALFAQPGKTRVVPEGKVIDGWMVTSVAKDGVTLSAADHIRVIQLEGISRDEANKAARQQADETADENAALVATSRQDDADDLKLDGPMRDLVEATRRMTRRGGRDSAEPSD